MIKGLLGFLYAQVPVKEIVGAIGYRSATIFLKKKSRNFQMRSNCRKPLLYQVRQDQFALRPCLTAPRPKLKQIRIYQVGWMRFLIVCGVNIPCRDQGQNCSCMVWIMTLFLTK